jgi:hypothetical protein
VYQLEDRIENSVLKTNATITRLLKTELSGPHDYVEMRRLEISRDSSGIVGKANEFYRQYFALDSVDRLMTTALNTGKITSANFTTTNNVASNVAGSPLIGQIIANTAINALNANFSYAGSCMLASNQDPTAATITCLTPTQTISAPSLATAVTSLGALKVQTNLNSGPAPSNFAGIFQLNP